MKEVRPRMSEAEYKAFLEFRQKKNNILVIGDLHAPFIKEGYLEFCLEMYYKHQCNNTVLIGDIMDLHFSSYHEADPDGFGAGEELRRAKMQIEEFYKAFPKAKVCIGNHDLIPNRKAFTGGLSKYWVMDISVVLDTPYWEYSEEFIIDGVLYTHGTNRKAKQRCQQEFISVVQGHYHSESYIETFVSEERLVFAMQIGSGVDRKAYAMAYGRHFKKPQINVGIVMDNGRYGIIEPMKM